MQSELVSLSLLDLIFLALALVSLVFNVIQWRERKSLREPLANTVRALFNDVKSKENNAYFVYNTLFLDANPHKGIETLKWEYGLFAQQTLAAYMGFKEALVGVLVSLSPSDKDDSKVVRASEYGLTDYEIEMRDEFLRLRQQALRPEAEEAAGQPAKTAVKGE